MKNPKQKPRPVLIGITLLIGLGAMNYLLAGLSPGLGTALAVTGAVERRINIPYLGAGPPPPDEASANFFEPAIFWFGQVTPTVNNADVRSWYYDEYMKVAVHIIDRRLWYDESPSPATLEEWDAVSLFLGLDGNAGALPTPSAYRLVKQMWRGSSYQVAYRGDGSAWVEAPVSFAAEPNWRGDTPNNDGNDKGWQVTFTIPFSSLGLPGPPAQGTNWGLAVVVHDRDNAEGNPVIAAQVWPESAERNVPASWGEMNFGIPSYSRPVALPQGVATIRQGVSGVEVVDGHVGGHGNCGDGLDHWTEWGEKNYAGETQINIQNQWDISDYPCFSKYFVTFPLDTMVPGKIVLAASLSMTMFGNAGGGEWGAPLDSYIQVLTVAEDWNEQTLTWNNAPWALENISGTWVKPVQTSNQRTYEWDVSRAVSSAYQAGEPLRLAVYSADGERHSGKYFWSSDGVGWDPDKRPTLRVAWGVPCDAAGVECHLSFLPAISR